LIEQKELDVHNIDVFCEQGVFDVEQSRAILESGKSVGLKINFHGDELNPLNSVEVCFFFYILPIFQCKKYSKNIFFLFRLTLL
jgi:hypothetical protein